MVSVGKVIAIPLSDGHLTSNDNRKGSVRREGAIVTVGLKFKSFSILIVVPKT